MTRSPIFIGGHHRSGTTLMRGILHSHPHIGIGPESNLFRDNRLARIRDYLRGEWATGIEPRYRFDSAAVDRVLADLIEAAIEPYIRARGKQRWGEKTPKNILFIDVLFALFPAAQFLHMIRDPRDVLCSVREKAATTTPRWQGRTAAQTATEWCRRIRFGLPWRQHPQRYREVRYEALAATPEATVRDVLDFLGEPWSEAVLEGKTIRANSVGRWRRDLTTAEVAEIEAIAGETMLSLGYELSAPTVPTGPG